MFELIISQLWPYLLGAIGLIAAYFGVRQSGKSAGKQEAKAEQAEATIKGMGDARDASDEIDSLDDAAVRDRARQRMRNGKR